MDVDGVHHAAVVEPPGNGEKSAGTPIRWNEGQEKYPDSHWTFRRIRLKSSLELRVGRARFRAGSEGKSSECCDGALRVTRQVNKARAG